MQNKILIVDDEPLVCKSLSEVLLRAGYEVCTANDGYEALEIIQQEPIRVVITDMRMPRMDGLEVLKRAKDMVPDIVVIIITAYASVDSAIEAMKYGALDYITKPVSMPRIYSVVERAILNVPARIERYPESFSTSRDIVTANPQMLDIIKQVKLIARTDFNVLIQGESGTGKELIAKAIHKYSNRARGPYIAVNCASPSEGVLESELFGHEKGSFTGAIARRIGMIELADGGTLFLDEISEMARSFQAKLLRSIQEREIIRVGGTYPVKVNMRIIASTNKNLMEEMNAGNFREDLFYRLCVIPVFVPPLRERKDDIPLLARYFAQQTCAQMGIKTIDISPEFMKALENYSWPGNVRELENTIDRAIALSQEGDADLDKIFFKTRNKSSGYISMEIGTSLEEAEKELIIKTLETVGGNKEKAAGILGITSKTILSKLRQYGYK